MLKVVNGVGTMVDSMSRTDQMVHLTDKDVEYCFSSSTSFSSCLIHSCSYALRAIWSARIKASAQKLGPGIDWVWSSGDDVHVCYKLNTCQLPMTMFFHVRFWKSTVDCFRYHFAAERRKLFWKTMMDVIELHLFTQWTFWGCLSVPFLEQTLRALVCTT